MTFPAFATQSTVAYSSFDTILTWSGLATWTPAARQVAWNEVQPAETWLSEQYVSAQCNRELTKSDDLHWATADDDLLLFGMSENETLASGKRHPWMHWSALIRGVRSREAAWVVGRVRATSAAERETSHIDGVDGHRGMVRVEMGGSNKGGKGLKDDTDVFSVHIGGR